MSLDYLVEQCVRNGWIVCAWIVIFCVFRCFKSNRKVKTVILKDKSKITHNSYLFSFEYYNCLSHLLLPYSSIFPISQLHSISKKYLTSSSHLSIPIGKHLKFHLPPTHHVNHLHPNKPAFPTTRPYSPIRVFPGGFDLLVKIYPNGKMSSYLHHLPIHSTLQISGPFGRFCYDSHRHWNAFILIAGGTGITPLWRFLLEKVAEPNCQIFLFFGSKSENDILLREELEQLACQHKHFHCEHVLSEPSPSWSGLRGFVNERMIEGQLALNESLGLSTRLLICGPPPMTDVWLAACTKNNWTHFIF